MKKSLVWCFVAAMAVLSGGCSMAGAAEPLASPSSELDDVPKELAVDLGGGVKLDLVLIPAGSFTMGDDGVAEPVHKVTITKPFYLGKYEVTQEQWEAAMGSNPSHFKVSKNPVEQVSWDDCQQFLVKLNAKSGGQGSRFVLPTESQWEYACRAESTGKFCFGDDEKQLGEYAWYKANSGDKPQPVGEKKPNTFGLHDMHGNVWEWCQDLYGRYGMEAVGIPIGPTTHSFRVTRGEGWCSGGRDCQSASRCGSWPGFRGRDLGLRVARVAAAGPASPASEDEPIAGPSPEQPTAPPEPATAEPPTAPQQKVSPEQHAAAEKLGLPVTITNSIGMKLVLIPAGEFQMGSPATAGRGILEQQHQVRITKPFHLGVHEVTQEQCERVMRTNPSQIKGPQKPVDNVSWDDAVEFCNKLSALPEEKAAGRTYRLPTEAEWEYACRAGSTTRYSCGDDEGALVDHAWFRGNSSSTHAWFRDISSLTTHPVGEKRPNDWGLYDMHGNVWEWCADWYDYYKISPVDDPTGPATGSDRVYRGGAWFSDASDCRVAYRYGNQPDPRKHFGLGFRVAADLPARTADSTRSDGP